MRGRVVVPVAVLVVGAAVLSAALVPGSRASAGPRLQKTPIVRRSYPAPPLRLRPGQHPYSSIVRVQTAPGLAQLVRVNYLLYAPAAYGKDPKRRWPLILFLHGGGERGDNLELLKAQPLPKTLAGPATFPSIVVSPQLPPQLSSWSEMIEPLDVLLQGLETRYPVDRHRLYLTGLSTGGFGTWHYGLTHPQRFAALVPIAGGYEQGSSAVPGNICALRNVPIWVFHGALDTIVYPYQSEILVRALRACGSKVVRFTLYAGVDHFGSWPRAYADPALWRWLFSQKQSTGNRRQSRQSRG